MYMKCFQKVPPWGAVFKKQAVLFNPGLSGRPAGNRDFHCVYEMVSNSGSTQCEASVNHYTPERLLTVNTPFHLPELQPVKKTCFRINNSLVITET